MYAKIIFIGFFFLFPFWVSASQCSNSNVVSIFIEFEKNYNQNMQKDSQDKLRIWLKESADNFLKKLEKEDVYWAKNFFKEKQDKKFELALWYFYENVEVIWLKKFKKKWWKATWTALEKLKELSKIDFYVQNEEEKIKNYTYIPSDILFKSILFDWMIYSCYLQNQIWKIKFEKDISLTFNKEKTSSALIVSEIIKQKEVAQYVILKYQWLIDNYKIHLKLQSIIWYLDKLRTRLADLASIIWFLPAKVVNFGFEK